MKKVICCWIVALLVVTLSGCWDVQDISDRAYITSIGVDKAEKENEYKVTFEIVLPELINLRGQDSPANFVQTLEASSMGTALEELQARISRQLNLGHVRVLVIGEDLAKEKNFYDIADFFYRSPNIQLRIRLLVVQNAEAKDILQTNPVLENYIAKELIDLSQINNALSRTISFFEFVAGLREHEGRGFISRCLNAEAGNIFIVHGAGVFNHARLIGWLSSEETRNANWLMRQEQFTIDAQSGESIYTYMVDSKSVDIKPIEESGDIRFNVKIKTVGPLMQKQGEHLDASDPKTLKQLEKMFASTIKSQVESAIAKAQKDFRVDYLGFDSAMKTADSKKFEQMAWEEIFPQLPITVEVDAQVNRFGLSK